MGRWKKGTLFVVTARGVKQAIHPQIVMRHSLCAGMTTPWTKLKIQEVRGNAKRK